ncbi:LexA family protein [Orenia marismortui]|uniref:LexA family protein n=1 Tax=Orenia marismortui TaxID=46469 RepID=UPI0003A2FA71|nr:S24 family peptidase [Orenia marismortui]
MDAGKVLKKLRMEMNLTQKELADKLGITRGAIGHYEQGKRSPDNEMLAKLADFFDVSVDYLLGRTDMRTPLPPGAIPVDFEKDMIEIPVIGTIPCGTPVLAEQNIIGYEYVRKQDINGGTYFYLKATGDSMVNSNIREGSLVLIRKQEDVENKEIAVVMVNGDEATLKRVHKKGEFIILHADNDKYDPMIYSANEVKIIGKAVEVKTKL